jgi:hypothetical protein
MTRRLLATLTAALLVASIASTAGAAKPRKKAPRGPAPLAFDIRTVAPRGGGGEPSIAIAKDGYVYASWPGDGGMHFASSRNNGRSWKQGAFADSGSGDTTVNVDDSGAVYESNLNGNLQGDVYKSFDHGASWPQKGATAVGDSASTQPFFVDRQWTDAYIPPGKTTEEAVVYLTYHDFVPSQIWVNVSKDGGKTFDFPVDVIGAQGNLDSFCDTIPGGLRVAQSGPHAGRVYVLWVAGDIATNLATGCNITQLTTFHSVWVAWSDNQGATWANRRVFDAGFGHDAGALFADLAVDNQGNPYASFAMNAGKGFWDVYATGSFDGGESWLRPQQVNSTKGTHYFPAIAAGDPGKVVISYIATDRDVPKLPYGKAAPAGDQVAAWHLYLAQSLDLRAESPVWTTKRVTTKPLHIGDVCVLGIFCTVFFPVGADRSLLDFIDVAVDAAGRAHIAYTDTADKDCVCVANQTSGPDVIGR